MAKDPAFLFYTADFYSGVAGMTMTERGQYITLLCVQHQQGHLSERLICVTLNINSVNEIPYVMEKFKKDKDGLYFNERLDNEIQTRAKYCDSRKKGATARWNK